MNLSEKYRTLSLESYVVLGTRLRHLSISRYRYLESFRCFPISSISDLLMCVLICSIEVGQIRRTLKSKLLPFIIWIWRKRLGKKVDYAQAIEDFDEYFRGNYFFPSIVQNNPSGKKMGAPFIDYLEVFARSKLNWTQSMIDCEPIAKAILHQCTYLEMDGTLQIQSFDEDEIEFDNQMFELANSMHDDLIKKAEELKANGSI